MLVLDIILVSALAYALLAIIISNRLAERGVAAPLLALLSLLLGSGLFAYSTYLSDPQSLVSASLILTPLLLLAIIAANLTARALHARAIARQFTQLYAASQTAPQPALQQQVNTTLVLLATDELVAQRLDASAQTWLPAFVDQRDPKEPMKPVVSYIKNLRYGGLALAGLAGLEQAHNYAPALAQNLEHLTLLSYAGLLPKDVHAEAFANFRALAHAVDAKSLSLSSDQYAALFSGIEHALDGFNGKIIERVAEHVLDPVAITQNLNHLLLTHADQLQLVNVDQLFQWTVDNLDHIKVGIEFTAQLLHADALAPFATQYLTDAVQGIQTLLDMNLVPGTQLAEQFLQNHGDILSSHMETLSQTAQHGLMHGIPIVSAIFIGFRQVKAISKGDVGIVEGTVTGVIDFAAIWAGSAAGAQAGLAFGPHGAVIGAIVGALFLGIFRKAMKDQELKDAFARCQDIAQQLSTEIATWEDRAIPAVQQVAERMRREYLEHFIHAPSLEAALAGSAQPVNALASYYANRFDEARKIVFAAKKLQASKGWSRAFARMPDIDAMLHPISARLDLIAKSLPAPALTQTRPYQAFQQLAPLAAVASADPAERALWQANITSLTAALPAYRHRVIQWNENAIERFNDTAEQISPTLDTEIQRFNDAMRPLKDRLDVEIDVYNRVARKLGRKPIPHS